ncbi:MAG: MATE family efflux transporter [Clostridia bacterium]|nr:MATE family efflux transporter [Clostridia bacterium]
MNPIKSLLLPEYMIRADRRLGPSSDYHPGTMYSTFVRVAWPALLETVLAGLINFVDSVMVSSVGEEAIAAVGLTNQPRLIFYAVFFALSVAVNAIVARRYGEGNREGANQCLAQVLPLALILGVSLCAIAILTAKPMLIFAGAKDDTIDMATDYYIIVMIGTIFSSITLMINAAQRGCGNTRISMVTNISANIVNVIFNALLINGLFFFPKLGVTGAAIATMLGNIVSTVIAFASILRKDRFLRFNLHNCFKIYPDYLRLLCKIGSGAIVEQVFLRIGFFLTAKLVADLGTIAFATHQSCMSIVNLSFTVGDGLGVAASALVGQNLGRRRPDWSTIYGGIAQRIGGAVAIVLMLLFTLGGRMLMMLFSDEAVVIDTGRTLLMILAIITPAQITQVIFNGCLRGAGDTRYTAMVSLLSVAILRPVTTYLLAYPLGFGVTGAWLAMLIDQYTRLICSAIRFMSGKWSKIKV